VQQIRFDFANLVLLA